MKYGQFTINYDASPVDYFAFPFNFYISSVHSGGQTIKYDPLTVNLAPFIPYQDTNMIQNDTSGIE
ncbi:MAG: hypothetical protein Q4A89_05275 [Tannerella sp.]|nr:hypothetical protein [Tannerella sp.]